MNDPDISVATVKLNSLVETEDVETVPNWLGSAKDCHSLWESLRQQGQLFKVLDTLTSKTADLIGRLQNQTATEEDSFIAVELLSKIGILFVDVETNEEGTQEKRYTFVTDNEATPQKVIAAKQPQLEQPQPKSQNVDPLPVSLEREFESDDGCDDDESIGDGDDSEEQRYVCDWCLEDQGTPVMLDLHRLRNCKILKKSLGNNRPVCCPHCDTNFRRLNSFQKHLIERHRVAMVEAIEIIKKVGIRKQKDKPKLGRATGNKGATLQSMDAMRCEVCQEKYVSRISLRTHLMDGHDYSRQKAVSSVYQSAKLMEMSELESNQKKPDEAKVTTKCPECDSGVSDVPELVQHLHLTHCVPRTKAEKLASKHFREATARFCCDLCPSKYKSKYTLSKHFSNIHRLPKKKIQRKISAFIKPSSTNFRCSRCKDSYIDRATLSSHLEVKHGLTKMEATWEVAKLYPRTSSVTKEPEADVPSTEKEQSTSEPIQGDKEVNSPEHPSTTLTDKTDTVTEVESVQNKEREGDGDMDGGDDGADTGGATQGATGGATQGATGGATQDAAGIATQDATGGATQDATGGATQDATGGATQDATGGATQDATGGKALSTEETNIQDVTDDSPSQAKISNDDSDTNMEITDAEDLEDVDYVPEETEPKPKRRGRPPKKKLVKSKVKGKPGRKTGGRNSQSRRKCPHPLCDKTFADLYNTKLHLTTFHKEEPPYQCSTCKKHFYQRYTFLRHLTAHKNKEMGVKFPCEVCNKVFYDKYMLVNHSKIHASEAPYKCEYCNKGYFHKSHFTRHTNLHTKSVEYKCESCEKVFYRKSGLQYHMLAIHENRRDHVCSQCGLGFTSKSTKAAHELTHNDDQPFQCDICGTKMKTKGNLKEHILCVHTNKRDFKCEICQKTFNRSHRLTLHMMMHRDERPHKCHLCDKGFRTRTNLRVHIKWHQNERDFQCEQCGKTFLIPGNLDRHMQTHRGDRSLKKKPGKKQVTETPKAVDGQGDGVIIAQEVTDVDGTTVIADVSTTVDSQFQNVTGYVSDLPTLASIAQHLSAMNIPVFQVPTSTGDGNMQVPVTLSTDEGEASIATLTVYNAAQPQLSTDTQADVGAFDLAM